jgi:cation diffusion facilitator CzcD-associated flavoprotein CzcO
MNEVKTTYRGIEVRYNEHTSEWSCELFTKPAETLRLAKERVDKKLDTEKKKPFKRFKAYVKSVGYNHDAGSWPLVEVTSVTDNGQEAWVSCGGDRQKVSSAYGHNPVPVYPETPENTALVNEIHELETAQKKIHQRIEDATKKLKLWKPEKTSVVAEPSNDGR